MKTLHIVLGNQLFPLEYYNSPDTLYFMAEDNFLASRLRFHKLKIGFFFIAMRRYRDLLLSKNKKVEYFELNDQNFQSQFSDKVLQVLKKYQITELQCYEIEDKFFEQALKLFCRDHNIQLKILPSPLFLISRDSFKDYLNKSKKPFLKTFYERERKNLNILMDKGNPVGLQFSFDTENRKKLPAKIEIPTPKWPNPYKIPHASEVFEVIKKYFDHHPGDVENFWLPTERNEALKWTKRFIDERLENFGTYQDAMTNDHDFLFHSGISSFLNVGLVLPHEVIKMVEAAYYDKGYPLNSVEGFIRQVLGWREFVRGIYQNFSEVQDEKNFFNHQRKLGVSWYNGTTGIDPLDFAIQRTLKYAHTHHIERLMVISNIMLLSEINPREVHRWFMENYVDSSEWVMGPNVYGMGQFSDGGIFATKPYICGSNYILKMSNYKKGPWCDTLDALYWSFIYKKRLFLKKNPRLAMMAQTVEKMEQKKIAKYLELADNFMDKHTI